MRVITVMMFLGGLLACRVEGVCSITCTTQTSLGSAAQDVGPYYDETEDECEEERQRATEELESWGGVCEAAWEPY